MGTVLLENGAVALAVAGICSSHFEDADNPTSKAAVECI